MYRNFYFDCNLHSYIQCNTEGKSGCAFKSVDIECICVCIWLRAHPFGWYISKLKLKWNCMQFFILFDSIKWKTGDTCGENTRLLWNVAAQLWLLLLLLLLLCCAVLCCVYFVFNSLCHFATEYKKRNMPPPLDSVRLVWLVIMIKWTEQKQSKANQFEFEAKETLTGRIPYSHTIHSSGWKSHRQCLEIRMFMLWHWSRTSQSQSWFDFSCWCFLCLCVVPVLEHGTGVLLSLQENASINSVFLSFEWKKRWWIAQPLIWYVHADIQWPRVRRKKGNSSNKSNGREKQSENVFVDWWRKKRKRTKFTI